MQGIKGEIVVTGEILDSINAIYDARVPRSWLYNPAGDEVSWLSPTLGAWYASLLSRDGQYRSWLYDGRPNSFWLTGFFNPQGYLTAVQQEITRAHKNENWALDSVIVHATVTEIMNPDNVKSHPKEGLYVHGLFMDGAAWRPHEGTLVESEPKKLFSAMPLILVTAVTKADKRQLAGGGNYGPFGAYDCPVYKYPIRSDKYFVFTVMLATQEKKPLHWTLRGVALLCSTS